MCIQHSACLWMVDLMWWCICIASIALKDKKVVLPTAVVLFSFGPVTCRSSLELMASSCKWEGEGSLLFLSQHKQLPPKTCPSLPYQALRLPMHLTCLLDPQITHWQYYIKVCHAYHSNARLTVNTINYTNTCGSPNLELGAANGKLHFEEVVAH